MFCPNCGNKVSDGDKFCLKCGAKLEAVEEVKTDEPKQVQPAPQAKVYQQKDKVEKEQSNENASKMESSQTSPQVKVYQSEENKPQNTAVEKEPFIKEGSLPHKCLKFLFRVSAYLLTAGIMIKLIHFLAITFDIFQSWLGYSYRRGYEYSTEAIIISLVYMGIYFILGMMNDWRDI